ncbi:MAG TPA: sigma-70 family RNA polymerase sigma factor [Gemmataceae bacterium]|jgi:RNA polymerase sigma factor (sigma-70 family)|nr:sigma-70 family RNA polymerase sigma factor [Gemmataceae bacterium]
MKRSFLESVLRGAEALAARDPVGTLPDRELVMRFAANRDSAAFAMLVRRHGPLVWGVCRNLLTSDADAEDAFQATFLALVRSAGTIQRTEALGGWLHGVAYRVALKARRSAARRKTRESKAAVGEADSPVPDTAWDDLQAAVHEEVCKLPDKLRLPFVLCSLQGRPQKDAAKELGWTIGTFSGRLSEARRKLLDRLARRGVPVGVAVGAAVLGGVAGGASVPTGLFANVLSAAAAPDAVSPSILSLARGVTHVYLTRTKLLAASVVLVGLLTTGIGAKVLSRADAQQPPRKAEPEPVNRAIDFLRSKQLEYRFVPVEKPLTTADLQKVLAVADEEGWAYCGSQELVNEKTGKLMPHMVFKHQRWTALAKDEIGLSRLALDAAAEEAKAKELAARKKAEIDFLNARDQAAAEAERAAALKSAEVEALRKQEKALLEQAAAAEKAALQNLRKTKEEEAEKEILARRQLADRERQLADLQARYEALVQKMEAELKTKAATSGKTGDLLPPEKLVTVEVKLKNVEGIVAAQALGKLLPSAKIVAEVRKDAITLIGPSKQIDEVRELIQKSIDVKAGGAFDTNKGKDKETQLVVIPLKTVKASEVAKVVGEVIGKSNGKVTSDDNTNSLLIAATPEVIDQIKKLLVELDSKSGRPK